MTFIGLLALLAIASTTCAQEFSQYTATNLPAFYGKLTVYAVEMLYRDHCPLLVRKHQHVIRSEHTVPSSRTHKISVSLC